MLRLALAATLPFFAQSPPASRAASAPAAAPSDFVLAPEPIPVAGAADPEVEKELEELAKLDRVERSTAGAEGAEGLRRLKVNSANRVARLDQLWMEGKLVAPRARYLAAMLYQFGSSLADIAKAYALARSAAEGGVAEARLLAASGEDNLLVRQRKPQRWGTQYFYKNDLIQLAPVDDSVTDAQRARWGVPTLAAAREYVEKWKRDRAAGASQPASRKAP